MTLAVGSWTLQDFQLQSSTIRIELPDLSDPGPIDPAAWAAAVATVGNALAAASDAGIKRTVGSFVTTTPTGAATDGAYSDIEDKALLQFKDQNGKIHTMQVPAPEDTLFLTDEETVDNNDALVAAIIAAVQALVALAGATWNYYKGYRKRAPTRRGVAGAPIETV